MAYVPLNFEYQAPPSTITVHVCQVPIPVLLNRAMENDASLNAFETDKPIPIPVQNFYDILFPVTKCK